MLAELGISVTLTGDGVEPVVEDVVPPPHPMSVSVITTTKRLRNFESMGSIEGK